VLVSIACHRKSVHKFERDSCMIELQNSPYDIKILLLHHRRLVVLHWTSLYIVVRGPWPFHARMEYTISTHMITSHCTSQSHGLDVQHLRCNAMLLVRKPCLLQFAYNLYAFVRFELTAHTKHAITLQPVILSLELN